MLPYYKKQLVKYLKIVSNDNNFIISIGSYAGQNKEDAKKIINYIKSQKNITEADVLQLAMKIHYENKNMHGKTIKR